MGSRETPLEPVRSKGFPREAGQPQACSGVQVLRGHHFVVPDCQGLPLPPLRDGWGPLVRSSQPRAKVQSRSRAQVQSVLEG